MLDSNQFEVLCYLLGDKQYLPRHDIILCASDHHLESSSHILEMWELYDVHSDCYFDTGNSRVN